MFFFGPCDSTGFCRSILGTVVPGSTTPMSRVAGLWACVAPTFATQASHMCLGRLGLCNGLYGYREVFYSVKFLNLACKKHADMNKDHIIDQKWISQIQSKSLFLQLSCSLWHFQCHLTPGYHGFVTAVCEEAGVIDNLLGQWPLNRFAVSNCQGGNYSVSGHCAPVLCGAPPKLPKVPGGSGWIRWIGDSFSSLPIRLATKPGRSSYGRCHQAELQLWRTGALHLSQAKACFGDGNGLELMFEWMQKAHLQLGKTGKTPNTKHQPLPFHKKFDVLVVHCFSCWSCGKPLGDDFVFEICSSNFASYKILQILYPKRFCCLKLWQHEEVPRTAAGALLAHQPLGDQWQLPGGATELTQFFDHQDLCKITRRY